MFPNFRYRVGCPGCQTLYSKTGRQVTLPHKHSTLWFGLERRERPEAVGAEDEVISVAVAIGVPRCTQCRRSGQWAFPDGCQGPIFRVRLGLSRWCLVVLLRMILRTLNQTSFSADCPVSSLPGPCLWAYYIVVGWGWQFISRPELMNRVLGPWEVVHRLFLLYDQWSRDGVLFKPEAFC